MLLERSTKGKIKKPHLILIYGTDGVGKTTFAASAPKPIVIGAESGSSNLDVSRFEPKTFEELMGVIEELRSSKHDYETVVFDSLDWIEPMVWKSVCDAGKVSSIENYGGGYGKGYTEANAYWLRMITALRQLREAKHMNIIMIAHSQIKAFNDPSQMTPYDRYILKLNEKAAALWREFVDTVLFANYEVFVKKENNKGKAFGDGMRLMHTERRPGFDAKNRFNLPSQLPLSWTDYNAAMNSIDPEDPAPIRESIAAMVANITDQELKDKVFETVGSAGDNAKQLQAIKDRLTIKLGAQ